MTGLPFDPCWEGGRPPNQQRATGHRQAAGTMSDAGTSASLAARLEDPYEDR